MANTPFDAESVTFGDWLSLMPIVASRTWYVDCFGVIVDSRGYEVLPALLEELTGCCFGHVGARATLEAGQHVLWCSKADPIGVENLCHLRRLFNAATRRTHPDRAALLIALEVVR